MVLCKEGAYIPKSRVHQGRGRCGDQASHRLNPLINLLAQEVVPNTSCQIYNKIRHSKCLYTKSGKFAYFVGTIVDSMSNTVLEVAIYYPWCLDSRACII